MNAKLSNDFDVDIIDIHHKHKKDKPLFKKKITSIKNNIIFATLTSNMGGFSIISILKSLKQNTLHHFSTIII